jgi:hypothetical protein
VLRLLRIALLALVPLVTIAAVAGCEDDSTAPPGDMAAPTGSSDMASTDLATD